MQSGGAVLLVTKKIADIHSMGSNISHLGKRKIIFKSALGGDMLVPRRVATKLISYPSHHLKGWKSLVYMVQDSSCQL